MTTPDLRAAGRGGFEQFPFDIAAARIRLNTVSVY